MKRKRLRDEGACKRKRLKQQDTSDHDSDNESSDTTASPSPPQWVIIDQDRESQGYYHIREDDTDSIHDKSISTGVVRIYRRSEWLRAGHNHPDWLAESESLASTTLPQLPTPLTLRIPKRVIDMGLVSNPQLETLLYAVRAFSRRSDDAAGGYFLGDGTGCGKGRVIAALIWHLWNSGYRRHLWVSVGTDLAQDAARDLADIGAGHIPVLELGSVKMVTLDSEEGRSEADRSVKTARPDLWRWDGSGVIFCTYAILTRGLSGYKDTLPYTPIPPQQQSDSSDNAGDPALVYLRETEFPEVIEDDSDSTATVTSRLEQVLRWLRSKSMHKNGSNVRYRKYLEAHDEVWKLPYWVYTAERKPGGLLCFDEAHKAKNLAVARGTTINKSVSGLLPMLSKVLYEGGCGRPGFKGTATGLVVKALQDILRHCPVLYASATGATELRNMAYIGRLGLWGTSNTKTITNSDLSTFPDFGSFRDAVERGGVAAMECLAMDLKTAGLYSCRTLSFTNVTFKTYIVKSSAEFGECYEAVGKLFRDIWRALTAPTFSYSKAVTMGSKSLATQQQQQPAGSASVRSHFWATQQRVMKQLLVSQKVRRAVGLARHAVDRGRQVVISLWGTGESRTADKMKQLMSKREDHLVDTFLSPPKLMMESFIEEKLTDAEESGVSYEILSGLRDQLNAIDFPKNPLDDLIDQLGGPSKVAELSGRAKRLTYDQDDTAYSNTVLRYTTRSAEGEEMIGGGRAGGGGFNLNSVNLKEQELFQSGNKSVAIITEAASAGISLHSDRSRDVESCPREMICLELPWAADKAIQQFGRVHRSNQSCAPTYHLMVSDVGGERRFVASIAKRMQTLGAITRGDRRAAFGHAHDKENLEGTFSIFSDEVDVYSTWGTQTRSVVMRWIEANAIGRHDLVPKIPGPTNTLGLLTDEGFAVDMFAMMIDSGIVESYTMPSLERDKLINVRTYTEYHPVLCMSQGDICALNSKRRPFLYVGSAATRDTGSSNTATPPETALTPTYITTSKTKDTSMREMDRFLNRVLLMPMKYQEALFDFYSKTYKEIVEAAKLSNQFDFGVESLNSSLVTSNTQRVDIIEKEKLFTHPDSEAQTFYFRLSVDRGISMSEAINMLKHSATPNTDESSSDGIKPSEDMPEHTSGIDGFYWLPSALQSSKPRVALVLQRRQFISTDSTVITLCRPHTGSAPLKLPTDLKGAAAHLAAKRWRKVTPTELPHLKETWTQQYVDSKTQCIHEQLWPKEGVAGCPRKRGADRCRVGRRCQEVHLIAGNIIPLWASLEEWFRDDEVEAEEEGDVSYDTGKMAGGKRPLRLVRAAISNESRVIIGVRIANNKVGVIKRHLKFRQEGSETTEAQQLAAIYNLYRDPSKFLKFFVFVFDVVASVAGEGENNSQGGIPIEEAFALTCEALDVEKRPLWTAEELKLILRALPPNKTVRLTTHTVPQMYAGYNAIRTAAETRTHRWFPALHCIQQNHIPS